VPGWARRSALWVTLGVDRRTNTASRGVRARHPAGPGIAHARRGEALEQRNKHPTWCDDQGRTLFRLVVGKAELPGRWLCVSRRFVPVE
jgi:hypothetical protein